MVHMNKQIRSHYQLAVMLTELLENRFKVGGFSFGIEPIISALPGIGDMLMFMISGYLVWIGMQMKLPASAISKMIANIIFDFLMGVIPFFGDIADFVFKANTKNMAILREYVDNQEVVEGEIVSKKT